MADLSVWPEQPGVFQAISGGSELEPGGYPLELYTIALFHPEGLRVRVMALIDIHDNIFDCGY